MATVLVFNSTWTRGGHDTVTLHPRGLKHSQASVWSCTPLVLGCLSFCSSLTLAPPLSPHSPRLLPSVLLLFMSRTLHCSFTVHAVVPPVVILVSVPSSSHFSSLLSRVSPLFCQFMFCSWSTLFILPVFSIYFSVIVLPPPGVSRPVDRHLLSIFHMLLTSRN